MHLILEIVKLQGRGESRENTLKTKGEDFSGGILATCCHIEIEGTGTQVSGASERLTRIVTEKGH